MENRTKKEKETWWDDSMKSRNRKKENEKEETIAEALQEPFHKQSTAYSE